jgi:hypothetical protein
MIAHFVPAMISPFVAMVGSPVSELDDMSNGSAK